MNRSVQEVAGDSGGEERQRKTELHFSQFPENGWG